LDHLQAGVAAYEKAASLLPVTVDPSDLAYLHYDVGVNQYFQALALEAAEEQTTCRAAAMLSVKRALTILPSSATFWLALGVLYERLDHRQHCIVRAMQCDALDSRPWTSLSILLAEQGELSVAHHTFSVAQSLGSDLAPPLVGQALVKELLSHGRVALDAAASALKSTPSNFTSTSSARPTSAGVAPAGGISSLGVSSTVQQAKASFQQSLGVDITREALLGLGFTAFRLQDYSRAAFALEKYIKVGFV
jgi:tetratricopeptide (TPR) repeat protein